MQLDGFASEPGATVKIRARDWNTDEVVEIGSAVASLTETSAGSSAYPWSTTIAAGVLPQRYWRPDQVSPLEFDWSTWSLQCRPTGALGRLELSGTQDGSAFRTFGQAAQLCVADKMMNEGASLADAG